MTFAIDFSPASDFFSKFTKQKTESQQLFREKTCKYFQLPTPGASLLSEL